MWGAAGNVEIYWHDGGSTIQNLRVANKRSTGNGTGADSDDDFRLRRGVPGLFKRQLHVF